MDLDCREYSSCDAQFQVSILAAIDIVMAVGFGLTSKPCSTINW